MKNKEKELRIPISSILKTPYTDVDLRKFLSWLTEHYGQGGRNKKYKWRYGWISRQVDYIYFRDKTILSHAILVWT